MSEVCFNSTVVQWKGERAFAWLKRKYRRLIIRWKGGHDREGPWKAFSTWLNFLVE